MTPESNDHIWPQPAAAYPAPSAVLELLKPITWFPPMWAYACGVVSSGAPIVENKYVALVGMILAGPLVCAMSQAINDWYDRHVDAINEPHRPIPSGRVPGMWGLYIAGIWTVLSLLVAATLGDLGADRRDRRPHPCVGVQRPAFPFETQWLVGKRRLRVFL